MALLITYPHGQGGMWLGNLAYGLITGRHNLTKPDINYHDLDQYPRHSSIITGHVVDTSIGYQHIGSFSSEKTQYTAYCNAYAKIPSNKNTLSKIEQFYLSSNDALWRRSQEFKDKFIVPMVLDADLLVTDPNLFMDNLYELLDQYSISYTANDNYVLASINNFNQTCWGQRVLADTDNLAWLAWCHSIELQHQRTVPFNIAENFEKFVAFVQERQDYYVDYTEENFIVI